MFKDKKFLFILIFACVVLEFIVMIPTFSKLKSQNSNTIFEWDKTVASSFHDGDGSLEKPYIISNASELAYFAKELESNTFEDKYVKLSNDIIINKGYFKNDDKSIYIEEDNNYYLDVSSSNYYLEESFETLKGTVNEFMSLDGFKGHLDGDFHTIYGLYLTGDNVALFTNFSGELSNLYIDNAYVFGNYEASGVVLDATDAKIQNVLFNGNVISNNTNDSVISDNIDDILVNGEYKIDLNLPLITSNLYSFVLTGECTSTVDTFEINGKEVNCGLFSLETDPYNIVINSKEDINLTNLQYTLTYQTGISSGIVSRSYNTNLSGLVNKGKIVGDNASGIIGVSYNSNIDNSYNIGKINGQNSSSIINLVLNSNIELKKVYSTSENIVFVNILNNSTMSLVNCFNTYLVKATNSVGSKVSILNSYNFEEVYIVYNIENIKSLYNGDEWLYSDLPILKFDEENNHLVNINVDNYTWNSYHTNINNLDFNDNISVLLTAKKEYKSLKHVSYYISNNVIDKSSLNNLEWIDYDNVITLNDKQAYIVYVKVVDYDDNIYYANTDRLNLNIENVYTSINTDDITWESYHEPKTQYVNKNLEFTLVAVDKNSDNVDIKYLVSNRNLSIDELNDIEVWNNYEHSFIIEASNYILYAKVTLSDGSTIYLNTDNIINKAYIVNNLKSGSNLLFNNNMTYNSSFNFDVTLNHELISTSLKRYIKTNISLPIGTLIILKDMDSKVVYQYTVSEEVKDNIYYLELFKEIGKMTFDNYFDDSAYNSKQIENFNINIYFNKIKKENKNLEIDFFASNNDIVIKMVNPIIINLYDADTDISNYLSINTNYANEPILYNNEFDVSIPISLSLNDLVIDNISVLNTNYENMHQGISIELVDSNGKIIDYDYYKGIKFVYNNEVYKPENDISLIDLGYVYDQNVLFDIVGNYDSSSNLEGTYYLRVKSYLSVDGKIRKYLSNDSILIPIEFNKDYTMLDYKFNVLLQGSAIINTDNNRIVNFKIIESGLTSPNVRISLYRKKELTAYNQDYVLIDLGEYIENKFTKLNDGSYYLLTSISDNVVNNFSIILNDKIESNGYMFKFQLYDGDNFVGDIDIKTIIR